MDIQQFLQDVMEMQRAEEMKTSPQLTLGKLIAKLEAIEDKSKPVIFDEIYHPSDIDSWRGSYCELALAYAKEHESMALSTADFLARIIPIAGATLYGYKGGEFLMTEDTPVWVANYGESGGFTYEGDIWSQAVIDVSEDEHRVIIETKNIEY